MHYMDKSAAETALTEYAAVVADRDNRVRRAYAEGITKNKIHTLTGIARTTIDRIFEENSVYATATQIIDLHRNWNQAATIDRGEGYDPITKADVLAAIDSYIEADGEVNEHGEPFGKGWQDIADQLNS